MLLNFGRANNAQKAAIQTTEGPVLIIAGPGTGKTFTLVNRVVYLVLEKNVKPSEIMVVTFTEKAGNELLTRISNEFLKYDSDVNVNEMYIGTFHSVCLRLLEEHSDFGEIENNYRTLDSFEQTYIVCRHIHNFSHLKGFSRHITASKPWNKAQEICRYVNLAMEELVDLSAMEADVDEDMRFLAKLVSVYSTLLQRNNVMDFSSILTKTYDMLMRDSDLLRELQNSLRYIMVDEYQDTNYIQEQLMLLLAGSRKNICVVGDDDQGMYRFRGATIRNILEFPSKFADGECKLIHLDINYRSDAGIIDFYNHWMSDVDGTNLFKWNGYRYDKQITSFQPGRNRTDSVYFCGGNSIDEEAEELLRMVKSLLENGNVSNYNQIAFLFRSVKSEEAVKLGAFFEQNGIPVYSPRSEMFFDRREVKQMLGCLMWCFRNYVLDLKNNTVIHKISYGLKNYYISCLYEARSLIYADSELYRFIKETENIINNLNGETDFGLLDIFYRLLSFKPFRLYLQANLKGNIKESRAARNLSEISRILSEYSLVHNVHNISAANKTLLTDGLFNVYLGFMYDDGIGEYEEESEYAPSGCVSFMTIHQSKGLEFPVVVVGSLGNVPRKNNDPLLYKAENRFFHRKPFEPIADIKFYDFWRIYYTAFSRAQNLLVLAKKKADSKYFGHYLAELKNVSEFNEKVQFARAKSVNRKQIYSFTSHISVYDGCPRQYKFYKEYAFAQNKMFQTSLGSLIHSTIENINNYFLDGNSDTPDAASVADWFEINCRRFQAQTGYSLSNDVRSDALEQAIRYSIRRGNDSASVWKAEEEINLVLPDYILQGVVDLIEDHGDVFEIVDFKTAPKPDVQSQPEIVEHYRKQLLIYAYLIEKKYGKPVSRTHLYYTDSPDGDPLITFECNEHDIAAAIAEVSQTVRNIESKNFESGVTNGYACTYCDMRYVCGKSDIGEDFYDRKY